MYKRNTEMGQQVSAATKQSCNTQDTATDNCVPEISIEKRIYKDVEEDESATEMDCERADTVVIQSENNTELQSTDDSCQNTIEQTLSDTTPSPSDVQMVNDELETTVILSHPYENSNDTTVICYDAQNTVLDYARQHEQPWKRSLDKFVRNHVLSNSSVSSSNKNETSHISDNINTNSTNNTDDKIDANFNQDEGSPSEDPLSLPPISLLTLTASRDTLKQCKHVRDYESRKKARLYGNANRFPYETIAINLVFTYLDAFSLLQATQVNRLWRDCAYEDIFQCWEHLLRCDFNVSSESIQLNVQRQQQLAQEVQLRTEEAEVRERKRLLREERAAKRAAAKLLLADKNKDKDKETLDNNDNYRSDKNANNADHNISSKHNSNSDKTSAISSLSTPSAAAVEDSINVPHSSHDHANDHGSTNADVTNNANVLTTIVDNIIDSNDSANIGSIVSANNSDTANKSAINTKDENTADPVKKVAVPYPPSYYRNTRARWAKEMYRELWRNYRQVAMRQDAYYYFTAANRPVVPLHFLSEYLR